MTTNKLTKAEFTKIFVKPLERKFGYKIHWSGKEAEKAGLKKITGNYCGFSFTSKPEAPIVVSFRKNQQGVLSTIIHEITHSHLHRKGTEGYKLPDEALEIEAETVAIRVLEKLDISLGKSWYIQKYQAKFKKKNGYEYKMVKRSKIIENMIEDVYSVLKPYKSLIHSLPNEDTGNSTAKEETYKYTVTCTCCGRVWHYKRAGVIVKTKAKGCYCNSCGVKSKDKLVVKNLQNSRNNINKQEVLTVAEAMVFIDKLIKKGSYENALNRISNLNERNTNTVAKLLDIDTQHSDGELLNRRIAYMIEYHIEEKLLLSEIL